LVKLEQTFASDLRQLITAESEMLMKENRGFAHALDEIGGLLSLHDPAPSPILRSIDLKGQDYATYFFAAYSDNRDIDNSILIYKTIKSLVRYILLMDRYYEVGNKRYQTIAQGLLRNIRSTHEGHLKYSINFALEQIWPFWDFEQTVKKLLIEGHSFQFKEIRNFSLFKSSDAQVIYARVLDNELANFDQNIASILHYNQALQDIQDDYDDIEEDLNDQMPNTFILAATNYIPYLRLIKDKNQGRSMIVNNSAIVNSILLLIEQYNQFIQEIGVPSNFAFLKQLSRDYTDRLLRTLGAQRQ
jgi:hypothetical protein